jgi:ribosomal-protein-alanine N-acetyltransferase
MVHLNQAKETRAGVDAVKLREYRPGDWEAMYALDLVCFEPVFRFSKRTMRGFAEAPGAVTVLVWADRDDSESELVGFCVAELEDAVGYVVTLDVAPHWRRRGLARRLMEEVEAHVCSAGGVGMSLHVYAGNAGAIRFYEGMDYGRAGMAEGFYGRGMHALVYRKKFEA